MPRKKVYPFHESLRSALGTADAALLALRLVRHIAFGLGADEDEVELLLALSSFRDPATVSEIAMMLPDYSGRQIAIALGKLTKKHRVLDVSEVADDPQGIYRYHIHAHNLAQLT